MATLVFSAVISLQPGKCAQLAPAHQWAQLLGQAEQLKARIRAKVVHPFHVIKNLLGHKKVRYEGLAQNKAQLFSLFGLANLVIAKKGLAAIQARSAPRARKTASKEALNYPGALRTRHSPCN